MYWHKIQEYIRKYSFLILVLEILGCIAAIVCICNNRTLHWDEAYTFQMVTTNTVPQIIYQTGQDIHPPLYYLLLKLVITVFGSGFIVFKLFSVGCTAAVMILGVTMIRKHWGNKVAFLFIPAVGLGPQFIYFAVDMRMYGLQLFFVTYCALLAYEIFKHDRNRDWVLFTLSALGGAYTHYFAIVPLALIYGFLLIDLVIKNKKSIKKFLLCSIATILGYLPWVFTMLRSFVAMGTTGEINLVQFDLKDLCEWMFSTNIEFSVIMGVTLFAVAWLVFGMHKNSLEFEQKLFLIMCGMNSFLSYTFCVLVASLNSHFWDNRYIYGSITMLWLFIFICITRWQKAAFYSLSCWLVIMVLSSYRIQTAKELGTNGYVDAAYAVLEQVKDEDVIIYNYPTYQVLYGAHLPDKEFVFIDDVDFEEFDKDYVYMISWGGAWFSDEIVDRYQLKTQNCGEMRFEEGMAGMVLYKISFQR